MMPCALVFAADMAAGSEANEPKNLRRNDVVGSESGKDLKRALIRQKTGQRVAIFMCSRNKARLT